jgi:hypothetical protein
MTTNHRSFDEPLAEALLPLLYQLVYCSRATPGVDDDAVQAIIQTAQRRNAQLGITGLLVFGSGVFFQWLEGPRDNITALMARLQADNRHQDIVTLDSSEEERERLFPAWDMELVSGEHIRDVLQDALDNARDAASAATLRGLLQRLETGELSQLGAA